MAKKGLVSVQIKGMKEMEAAFKKSPKIVASELNPAIKKSLLKIMGKSIPLTPNDRGGLRNSNVTTFSNLKGKLENRAPYAFWVHEGTKPHMPPISAVEDWARRHNIPAFLVARSIARKGTKPVKFYEKAITLESRSINVIFTKALELITIKLAS